MRQISKTKQGLQTTLCTHFSSACLYGWQMIGPHNCLLALLASFALADILPLEYATYKRYPSVF